ncbi:hybrid sensor histidine kinase/response regulator transcription factor [Compostibacter hankyongensis]|uniref:histidine kinase n=1 Tax=Compostibacter hankyongensis TaxID=1007089 RepID=A0ABP8FN22_9BACT
MQYGKDNGQPAGAGLRKALPKVKWLTVLTGILLCSRLSPAQQILFRNYTVNDGLCSNTVWAISQDEQGYMWFGTKDGLNRFDGYRFKSYRFDKDDSISLGNNWVRIITNYNEDSCLIGTEKGVYILDLAHETFHFFDKTGERSVFDMLRDRSGAIWIATAGGVFRYDPESGKLRHFIHEEGNVHSLSINFVRKLLLDGEGNIWMGTSWNGIDVLDPQTGIFRHYTAGGRPGDISSNFVTDLYKDLEGNIWVGTEKGGLNRWDKSSGTFIHYTHSGNNSISDNIVHSIYQPAPGKLYIGTEKGLDVLDLEEDTFVNYAYRSNDPHSLSDNAVYTIFKDRSGGVWVGTYFGGVDYFHEGNPGFELYYPTGAPGALSGKAVSAMLQDDSSHIWIATEDNGLNYFDTRTKTFQHFPFRAGQDDLSYHNIHTLIRDHAGKLWIGTFTGGINVYDPHTQRVKVYKFGQGSRVSSYSNMIYSLYEDTDRTIWAGTVGGLYTYAPEKDSFYRVHEMLLDKSWIYDIYEDSRHTLWFATYNHGLIGKNKRTGEWYRFTRNEGPHSLSSNKIICMAGGGDSLWLGTDGGGLNLLDTRREKITVFDDKKIVNADIIYGILKDKKGHLWLSTNNGIFDLDPVRRKSRHYTQWDHLQGKEFNYKSYMAASNGKFYFGGVHGFNAFYPDSLRSSGNAPRVIFTNFQLFNNDVAVDAGKSPLHRNITYTEALTLSHRQSMFSFEYAALNYTAPHKTQYAYKMEGYDKSWNYVGDQRKATYTNLPAGSYTFKVKATGNNGSWSSRPAQIAVTILPPFYKTTLAYIIYALLLVTIVMWIRKTEMKRIRRKNEIRLERQQTKREREFYKQKIDFFTSMAHEIRTPLSLIIAPLERLLGSAHWQPAAHKQLKVMEENSNRLLSLTNQLLDFRKMESDLYEIHPEKIELVSFVQSLFSRFSSISYQKGIRFSVSTHIPRLEVQADPEALTKILSNLLFNAFKFTRSKVELSINEPAANTEGSACFSISVEDDGIGIPKEEVEHIFEKFYQVSSGSHEYSNLGGNGIGLALAKALTEKHGGALLVKSEAKVKTVFTVLIPLGCEGAGSEKDDGEPSGDIREAVHKDAPAILIVEDDPALVDFMYESLQGDGYNVRKALNGSAALELLGRHTVDLIISDVMMPEMDGMEFCRKVKQDVHFSHIPLVLLTAKANPETEIAGIEEGADAYLTKPFKWKHLAAVIKNLLESRQRLKQKFSRQPFADASSLTTNSGDQQFLKRITDIIEQRLDDQQLSVEELSRAMAMSRSSLHKKLKAISGHVPNEFIRIIRLKQAAKLLLQHEYSISEIGYRTGFNSPSYFSRCFYQQFGVTPREFMEKEVSGRE